MARSKRRRDRRLERARQRDIRKCAYFFIPLPQPLNIEDGIIGVFADYFDPNSLSLDTFIDEFGHVREKAVSLKFHQISSPGHDARFTAAMEVTKKAFPAEASPGTADLSPQDARSVITVVEALLPVDSDEEGPLSLAFDSVIECIRMLQLGYARATGEPITQVSRMQMPFAVPLAVREYTLGEREPQWPQSKDFRLFLTNFHDPFVKGGAIAAQSTPHDFSEILHATRVAHEGPFARAHQLIEKAASFADHDNTVGSVLLGAACEMLVLDLSISLLWERGLDPEEASKKVLTKQNRTQRVTQLLRGPIREALGSAWGLIGDEGVSAFMSEVMSLRNRTIHQGEEPTDDEIRRAFQSNRNFQARVERSLLQQLSLYPLTAATLLPRGKFETLDKADELDDVLEEVPRPLDNWSAYAAYRFEVLRPKTRVGLSDEDELCGEVSRSHVAFLIHPDGQERWWLIDEQANVACPAFAPSLNRQQRQSLRRIRSEGHEFGIESSGAFACRFEGVAASPRSDPPKWHRLGDIWPMHRWDRYPAWPLPHPLTLDDQINE